MTYDQIASVSVLGLALVLFAWGKLRYDIVALSALLAGIILGVVPGGQAFVGFGHPAVITVAAVLILSRGLGESGATQIIADALAPLFKSRFAHIAGLSSVAAALSGFMNNVGALALLMPVAVQSAADAKAVAQPAADAIGLWLDPRWITDTHRHAAEYYCRHIPGSGAWRAVLYV